jgi:uncharacterized membrane protein YqjE
VLATLIEVARTRLALAATEVEEQRLRAKQGAVAAFATLFFASLAMVFATLAVIVAYWEQNPVAALGACAAIYLGLAAVAAAVWRVRAASRPRLFAATLAELARDRDELAPPK